MEVLLLMGLAVPLGVVIYIACAVLNYLSTISIYRMSIDTPRKANSDHSTTNKRESPNTEFFCEDGKFIGSCLSGNAWESYAISVAYSVRTLKPNDFNLYKLAWRFNALGYTVSRFAHIEHSSMLWANLCKPPTKIIAGRGRSSLNDTYKKRIH